MANAAASVIAKRRKRSIIGREVERAETVAHRPGSARAIIQASTPKTSQYEVVTKMLLALDDKVESRLGNIERLLSTLLANQNDTPTMMSPSTSSSEARGQRGAVVAASEYVDFDHRRISIDSALGQQLPNDPGQKDIQKWHLDTGETSAVDTGERAAVDTREIVVEERDDAKEASILDRVFPNKENCLQVPEKNERPRRGSSFQEELTRTKVVELEKRSASTGALPALASDSSSASPTRSPTCSRCNRLGLPVATPTILDDLGSQHKACKLSPPARALRELKSRFEISPSPKSSFKKLSSAENSGPPTPNPCGSRSSKSNNVQSASPANKMAKELSHKGLFFPSLEVQCVVSEGDTTPPPEQHFPAGKPTARWKSPHNRNASPPQPRGGPLDEASRRGSIGITTGGSLAALTGGQFLQSPRSDTSNEWNVPYTLREKICAILGEGEYDLTNRPAVNLWRYAITAVTFVIVMISIFILCLETLPIYHDRYVISFHVAESICAIWMIAEFTLRVTCSFDRKAFMFKMLNMIDIINLIPCVIDIYLLFAGNTQFAGTSAFAVIRSIRLARVFRILLLSRHSQGLQDIGVTCRQSGDAFLLAALLLGMATVICSTGVYLFEINDSVWDANIKKWVQDGEPIRFQSIPASFWWALVTLTTVGYGDDVPQSEGGRIVAMIAMMVGIFTIVFPTVILSVNFQTVREAKRNHGLHRTIRQFAASFHHGHPDNYSSASSVGSSFNLSKSFRPDIQ